jgi:hypothetical protein
MSPLIVGLTFVLAEEIMAIKLRETKHIRGIEIKLNSITGNLKSCQLADDTTYGFTFINLLFII